MLGRGLTHVVQRDAGLPRGQTRPVNGDRFEHRSELQAVETAAGLLLGSLTAVAISVGVWLVSDLLGLSDPAWSQAWFWGRMTAVAAGVVVVFWWLVHARRRGL